MLSRHDGGLAPVDLNEEFRLSVASGGLATPARLKKPLENSLGLTKVLTHPSLEHSLLSVIQLTEDGYDVLFLRGGRRCVIRKPNGESILACREGKLWKVGVEFYTKSDGFLCQEVAVEQKSGGALVSKARQHQRAGHFWLPGVKCDCDACNCGKGSKPSHAPVRRDDDFKGLAFNHLVAWDHQGPVDVPALPNNGRYALLGIDDHTDWGEAFIHRAKDENHKGLQDWVDMHCAPTYVRSDNATEYKKKESQWRQTAKKVDTQELSQKPTDSVKILTEEEFVALKPRRGRPKKEAAPGGGGGGGGGVAAVDETTAVPGGVGVPELKKSGKLPKRKLSDSVVAETAEPEPSKAKKGKKRALEKTVGVREQKQEVPVQHRVAKRIRGKQKRADLVQQGVLVPELPGDAPGMSFVNIPVPKQRSAKRSAAEFLDEVVAAEEKREHPSKKQKSSADLIFEAIEREEDQGIALMIADVLHGDVSYDSCDQKKLPKGLREGSADYEQWRAADGLEKRQLEEKGCWTVVDRKEVPAGTKIIPSCMLYNRKRCGRYKARIVARGDMQEVANDIDSDKYFDTYSPTVSFSSMRMVVVDAVRAGKSIKMCDISNAFINASLKRPGSEGGGYYEDVFMRLPNHWGGHIVRLERSLYGLRSAPKHWYLTLTRSLVQELGYTASTSDPGVFFKVINGERITCACYVDDILLTGSEANAERARAELLRRWAGKEIPPQIVDDIDLGPGCESFDVLGCDVIRRGRSVKFCQGRATRKLLERFDHASCKPVSTPGLSWENEGEESKFPVRQLIGAVNYISTCSRPDLAFSVQRISRCLVDPRKSVEAACKRLLRYLRGTADKGCIYSPERERDFYNAHRSELRISPEENPVVAFCDSNYADITEKDCKATSGHIVYMYGCPVLH
eukprot:gene357-90_t